MRKRRTAVSLRRQTDYFVMNIRKLLISITVISFGIPLHGAGNISDIDSLYTMFQNKESAGYVEEANKIMAKVGYEHTFTSEESFDDANALVLDVIVDYYRSKSEYVGRITYLNKALSFYTEHKDSMNVARCHHTLGATYQMLGLYDKAIQAYQQSSDILLAIGGDSSNLRYRYTLNNIAALFFEQDEMDKSEELYLKCLSLINDEEDETRNEIDCSTYLGNLAMVYNAKAESSPYASIAQSYLSKALENVTEAVAIAKKYCEGTSSEIEIVKREITLARTLMLQGDLNGADRVLSECDAYVARNSLEYQGIQVASIRGEIMERRGNPIVAERMYDKVRDYARKQGLKEMEGQALENLYVLLKDIRPAKALECLEKRTAIRDSIFTLQQNILISEFQVQYETQEKENLIRQQESELRQSKTVAWSLAVILLLCVGLASGIYRHVVFVRKRNRELKESNDTKDKMISIISHDLKNPAYAQRNVLRGLHSSWQQLENATIGNYINELLTSSESQVQLLSNLLDWARLQTGKLKCNIIEIDLSMIVSNEIKTLQGMADNKQVTIETRLVNGESALADREMVSVIIRNLITNAIKFSRSGSIVEVETGVDGDSAYCSIIDHGVGISEGNLAKVFTDAAVSTGTDDEPGTGLGLELCRNFTKLNNGRITVASKPGEGSTFTLYLKLARRDNED